MDSGKVIQYDILENIFKNLCNDFVSEFIGKNRIWFFLEFIRVKDIMIENLIICFKNILLLRCMEKMRSLKVDSLMIVDKLNCFLGIVIVK